MASPKLQEAQDALKSKSLDEREKLLLEREKLLDSSERFSQLELLDKQIAVKEQRLSELEDAIADKNGELTKAQKRYNDQVVSAEAEQERIASKQKKEAEKLSQLRDAIIQARNELATVNDDIAGRKKYLVEQEELVEHTVSDWSMRLGECMHEEKMLDERKQSKSADIVRLEQAVQEKQQEVDAIEGKAVQLQDIYMQKKTQISQELSVLRSHVQDKQNELLSLDMEQEAKIQGLKTREQSVTVREAAIRTQEMNLHERERALDMKLGILG
jgi:chromosome segregation ATPase